MTEPPDWIVIRGILQIALKAAVVDNPLHLTFIKVIERRQVLTAMVAMM